MARGLTDEEQEAWEAATQDIKTPKRKPRAALPPKSEKEKTAIPAVAKKAAPAPPLDLLPKRQATKRFRTRVEATLDLHGMTQDEAHAALNRFVARAHTQGKRHVAIITGKGSRGEGVLRRAVPRWLELPALRGLVSAIAHAAPKKGGEGVLHLRLKK